jgi:hypothetical protein
MSLSSRKNNSNSKQMNNQKKNNKNNKSKTAKNKPAILKTKTKTKTNKTIYPFERKKSIHLNSYLYNKFSKSINSTPVVNVSKLDDNPPLFIRPIYDPDNKDPNHYFNLIDDSYLPAGTKSRAVVKTLQFYINAHRKKYKLPVSEPLHVHGIFAQKGYGQIALSYGISKLKNENIIGHIHTLKLGEQHIPLIRKACSFGAKVLPNPIPINEYEIGHTYYHVYDYPSIWNVLDLIEEQTRDNPNSVFIGIGLDIEKFIEILAEQIEDALPKDLRKIKNEAFPIWVTASSGTILRALYKVFPNAFFNGVQTGIDVNEKIVDKTRTKIWKHPFPFSRNTDEIPPYDSLLNYDGKVWYFVRRYGNTGDYIWNVAGNVPNPHPHSHPQHNPRSRRPFNQHKKMK